MNDLVKLWKSESVAILSVVTAGVAIASDLGVNITADAANKLVALVALVAGIIARSQVTSKAGLEQRDKDLELLAAVEKANER